MSGQTGIQWTDSTWNIVVGCTRVSPGCARCYIERTPPFRMAGRRFAQVGAASTTGVTLHWDRLARPPRGPKVFTPSLGDLFHEDVPAEFVDAAFAAFAAHPERVFQVLTKRPERALELLGGRPPLANVWLGVSIENARYAWRADVLREIPAAVRFVSAEPLLGSLLDGHPPQARGRIGSADWGSYVAGAGPFDPAATCRNCGRDWGGHAGNGCFRPERSPLDLDAIDWLIVGGESGPGARPFRLEHARELIDACFRAGAGRPAIFVKQLGRDPVDGGTRLELRDAKGGDQDEWPPDLRIREFPRTAAAVAA